MFFTKITLILVRNSGGIFTWLHIINGEPHVKCCRS